MKILKSRSSGMVKILLCLCCLFGVVSCSESSSAEAPEDLEIRVANYVKELFPNVSEVVVESIEPDEASPFLKASILATASGRQQRSDVYLTKDGRFLVLGQVWDLEVAPAKARWGQMKQDSEERQAKLELTDRPFQGNVDAKVVVVEYSDYQCPFCSRAYSELETRIVADYGDRVKLVFKHLPLESIHPWAKKAAIAASCAYVQKPELFWEMHSRFFVNQKSIQADTLRDTVEEYGREIGLDQQELMACFDEEKTKAVVEADMGEASSLGLRSTPSFLINGVLLAGAVPYEQFSSYLDLALEEAEAQ
jgi:protein-disulfide isomerase